MKKELEVKKIRKEMKKAVEKEVDKESKIDTIKKSSKIIADIKKEIAKIVVGQEEIVDGLIRGLLCNGHVLVEGVPGIAKTLVIRALSKSIGCESKRIQFTVDLLPTDIIGLTTYTPGKGFEIIKGPIFANFIIADEINRSPPKTQSALLEAMQEHIVTIGKQTFDLPKPFFVMATQNPLETSGVYILPEAQIDRFLFKILMGYPKKDEEKKIVEQNITIHKFEEYPIKIITNPRMIIEMQELTKKIYLNDAIKEYIVNIVNMTREKNFSLGRYVDWGGSPRASIGLYIGSKAQALIKGRDFVTPQDVKSICKDVLRHRLILNYEGQVEGITSDKVVEEILKLVPVP